MPRQARKDLEGKHYHIMVQGIGKEYVFPDDNSKGFYISCLQSNKERYPVKLISFCVMGNHAHMLLSIENIAQLTAYLRQVNSDYARYYNRINRRVGYVFRDRYRSELIKTEKQIIYCLAYIQNNPVKAGIVDKAEDYIYSSYPNYLTGRGIVDFSEASKYFDIRSDNIRAIMEERNINEWMEHDDKEYEAKDTVFLELIERYNIQNNKMDDVLIVKIAKEIHERTGTSYREVANLLEISRERLRRLVSTPPSP